MFFPNLRIDSDMTYMLLYDRIRQFCKCPVSMGTIAYLRWSESWVAPLYIWWVLVGSVDGWTPKWAHVCAHTRVTEWTNYIRWFWVGCLAHFWQDFYCIIDYNISCTFSIFFLFAISSIALKQKYFKKNVNDLFQFFFSLKFIIFKWNVGFSWINYIYIHNIRFCNFHSYLCRLS